MDDKLQKLHQFLYENGAWKNNNDFNIFKEKFSSPEKQQALHGFMVEKGLWQKPDNFGEFQQKFFGGQQTPQSTTPLAETVRPESTMSAADFAIQKASQIEPTPVSGALQGAVEKVNPDLSTLGTENPRIFTPEQGQTYTMSEEEFEKPYQPPTTQISTAPQDSPFAIQQAETQKQIQTAGEKAKEAGYQPIETVMAQNIVKTNVRTDAKGEPLAEDQNKLQLDAAVEARQHIRDMAGETKLNDLLLMPLNVMASPLTGNFPFITEDKQRYGQWLQEAELLNIRNNQTPNSNQWNAANDKLMQFYSDNKIDPTKGVFQQMTGKTSDQAINETASKLPENPVWDKLEPKAKLSAYYMGLKQQSGKLNENNRFTDEYTGTQNSVLSLLGIQDDWSEPRKKYWELQNEMRNLAPLIATASYNPTRNNETWLSRHTKQLGESFNPFQGAQQQNQFRQNQSVINAINQTLGSGKVPEDLQKAAADTQTWTHFATEDLPQGLESTLGIMLPMAVGGIATPAAARLLSMAGNLSRMSALKNIPQTTSAIQSALLSKATTPFARMMTRAVIAGSEYQIAGTLLPKHGEELGFLSGAVGSVGSQAFDKLITPWIKKVIVAMPTNIATTFGKHIIEKPAFKEAYEFLKHTGVNGVRENFEEFGNSVGQMLASDESFGKQMEEQFGSLEKVTKFFLSNMFVSRILGSWAKDTKPFTTAQDAFTSTPELKKMWDKMSLEEKNKATADFDKVKGATDQTQTQTAEAIVDGLGNSVPTDQQDIHASTNQKLEQQVRKDTEDLLTQIIPAAKETVKQTQTETLNVIADPNTTPEQKQAALDKLIADAKVVTDKVNEAQTKVEQQKELEKQKEAQEKQGNQESQQLLQDAATHLKQQVSEYDQSIVQAEREIEKLKADKQKNPKKPKIPKAPNTDKQIAALEAQIKGDTELREVARNEQAKYESELQNHKQYVQEKNNPTQTEPVAGQRVGEGQVNQGIGNETTNPLSNQGIETPSPETGQQQPVSPESGIPNAEHDAPIGTGEPTPQVGGGQPQTQTGGDANVQTGTQGQKVEQRDADWFDATEKEFNEIISNGDAVNDPVHNKKIFDKLDELGFNDFTSFYEAWNEAKRRENPTNAKENFLTTYEKKALVKLAGVLGKLFKTTAEVATAQEIAANHNAAAWLTLDGKVMLNPDKMQAASPMHENAHVFINMLKATNKPLYTRLVQTAKQDPTFEAKKAEYADVYAGNEDLAAEEVMATYLGEYITGKLDVEYLTSAAFVLAIENRWKAALKKVWEWIKTKILSALPQSIRKQFTDAKILEAIEKNKETITLQEIGDLLSGAINDQKQIISELIKGERTLYQVGQPKPFVRTVFKRIKDRFKGRYYDQLLDEGAYKAETKELATTIDQAYKLLEERELGRDGETIKTHVKPVYDLFESMVDSQTGALKDISNDPKERERIAKEIDRIFTPTNGQKSLFIQGFEKMRQASDDLYLQVKNLDDDSDAAFVAVQMLLVAQQDIGEVGKQIGMGFTEQVLGKKLNPVESTYLNTAFDFADIQNQLNDLGITNTQSLEAIARVLNASNVAFKEYADTSGLNIAKAGTQMGRLINSMKFLRRVSQTRLHLLDEELMTVVKGKGWDEKRMTELGENLQESIQETHEKGKEEIETDKQITDELGKLIDEQDGTTGETTTTGVLGELNEDEKEILSQVVPESYADVMNKLLSKLYNKVKEDMTPNSTLTPEQIETLKEKNWGVFILNELYQKATSLFNQDFADKDPEKSNHSLTPAEKFLRLIRDENYASQLLDDVKDPLINKILESKSLDDTQKAQAIHYIKGYIDSDLVPIYHQKLMNAAVKQVMRDVMSKNLKELTAANPKAQNEAIQAVLDEFEKGLQNLGAKGLSAAHALYISEQLRQQLKDIAQEDIAAKLQALTDTANLGIAANNEGDLSAADKAIISFINKARTAGLTGQALVDELNKDKNFARILKIWDLNDTDVNTLMSLAAQYDANTPNAKIVGEIQGFLRNRQQGFNFIHNLQKFVDRKTAGAMKQTLKEDTPISQMMNWVYKNALDIIRPELAKEGTKPAPTPKEQIDQIAAALETGQISGTQINEMWAQAQEAMRQKYADNPAILAALQKFFDASAPVAGIQNQLTALARNVLIGQGYVRANGTLNLDILIKDSNYHRGNALESLRAAVMAIDPKNPNVKKIADMVVEMYRQKIHDKQIKELQKQITASLLEDKQRKTILGYSTTGVTKVSASKLESFLKKANLLMATESSGNTVAQMAKAHFAKEFGGVTMTDADWAEFNRLKENAQKIPAGAAKEYAFEKLSAFIAYKTPGTILEHFTHLFYNTLLAGSRTFLTQATDALMGSVINPLADITKSVLQGNTAKAHMQIKAFTKAWGEGVTGFMAGLVFGYRDYGITTADSHANMPSYRAMEHYEYNKLSFTHILKSLKKVGVDTEKIPMFGNVLSMAAETGDRIAAVWIGRFMAAINNYNFYMISGQEYPNLRYNELMTERQSEVDFLHLHKNMSKSEAYNKVNKEVLAQIDRELFGSKDDVTKRQAEVSRVVEALGISEQEAKKRYGLTEQDGQDVITGQITKKEAGEIAFNEMKELKAELGLQYWQGLPNWATMFSADSLWQKHRAREIQANANLNPDERARAEELGATMNLQRNGGLWGLVNEHLKKRDEKLFRERTNLDHVIDTIGKVFIPFRASILNLVDRGLDFIPGGGYVNIWAVQQMIARERKKDKTDYAKIQQYQDLQGWILRRQLTGITLVPIMSAMLVGLKQALGTECGDMFGYTGSRNINFATRETNPCKENSLYLGKMRIPLDWFGMFGTQARFIANVSEVLQASKYKGYRDALKDKDISDEELSKIEQGTPMLEAVLTGLVFTMFDRNAAFTQIELLKNIQEAIKTQKIEPIQKIAIQGLSNLSRPLVGGSMNRTLGDIIEIIDNHKHSAKGLAGMYLSGLGFPKVLNPVKQDILGYPVKSDWVWNQDDPESQKLKKLLYDKYKGVELPSNVQLMIKGKKVTLSETELEKYRQVWGQELKSAMIRNYDTLQKLDVEKFDKAFNTLRKNANERAKQAYLELK